MTALFQAKTVHVQIDGKQVSPPEGYLIRKGPGNCYFDFAQEIVFAGQQKPPIPPTSETKMDSSVRSVMCVLKLPVQKLSTIYTHLIDSCYIYFLILPGEKTILNL